MVVVKAPAIQLMEYGDYSVGRFQALGCPCEVLFDSTDMPLVLDLLTQARDEAWRIERKYSRYRDDSVISRIHRQAGEPIQLDDETARLLDFAASLHALSEGRFDVTSGVLRRVWQFDQSDHLPSHAQVDEIRQLVGWPKLDWQSPVLTLPVGMELDLGGIGKEYAVDAVTELLARQTSMSLLVNFGGDLRCHGRRRNGVAWLVAIDNGSDGRPQTLQMQQGALATSGNQYRYLQRDGVRYSHILDPLTGWPVRRAPASVTVAASTCTQAGMLSTLAALQGAGAEAFLQQQEVTYWIYRDEITAG
ncbi:FAD:protein FMN transferase [Oceanobacter mangrovi]|uniref:FAD:protein FMN transferase n=1 Tax=Oceanobacter mangrovi TaxID=2862510 RepID=UPI001FE6F975|nr:FAD:protein FMN transferase [Oceanobacter mangrovi]